MAVGGCVVPYSRGEAGTQNAAEAPLARSGALPYVGPEAVNVDIGFRFIITDGQ